MTHGLSVVLPTRDRIDVIDRTLKALAEQSIDVPAEVIVVDNGSTDGTLAHAQAWERRCTRIPVRVLQEATPGVSAARHHGVQAACHDRILFLNDDTAPAADGLLAAHFALLEATPSGRAYLGRVTYPPDLMADPFLAWLNDFAQFDYRSLDAGGPTRAHHFITAHISFVRADYERAGGMEHRLPFGFEDAEIGARMLAMGVQIEYRPELIVHHMHHVTLSQWRARMLRMGTAGWQANELRANRSRLAPHTVGPYWVMQQLAADALAHMARLLPRLPGRARSLAFKLMHQGAYTRGYRSARRGAARR